MIVLKNWLYNKYFDLIFILSPPFFTLGLVYYFQDQFLAISDMPLYAWVILVLFIDVSHVYSTIFRTYLHEIEFKENRPLYILIPILVWILGVFLYSIHMKVFWSVLAYFAVYHFARQQYGFLRLYSRSEEYNAVSKWVDSILLYVSILYPIVFWHVNLPRKFNWFIEGDFIFHLPPILERITFFFYILIFIIFLSKETYLILKFQSINITKILVLSGTALSWYFGIVFFNNDFIFTITNVVAHGVPYIGLIWIYGKKEEKKNKDLKVFNALDYKYFFKTPGVIFFLLLLLVLGYTEEGFWAALVWREHLEFFPLFSGLNEIESQTILSWVVPLLTVPQATHYILDGFIWKLRDKKSYWNILFFEEKEESK